MNTAIEEMEKKYFDLVWYARKKPEHLSIDGVKENVQRIEKENPEECENLKSYEMGDWQHGFNSGCLAAFRYVMYFMEFGKDFADEEFPMLDS